jgi:hypothetical protein
MMILRNQKIQSEASLTFSVMTNTNFKKIKHKFKKGISPLFIGEIPFSIQPSLLPLTKAR